MSRPSLFIGSSSEGLEVAQAVRHLLEQDAEVAIWNTGFILKACTDGSRFGGRVVFEQGARK